VSQRLNWRARTLKGQGDKLIAEWTKTETSHNSADSAWDSFAFVFAGYGRYFRVALLQVASNSNFRQLGLGRLRGIGK